MLTLSVPDMSCGHCKASVESALGALPGTAAVAVDLTTRKVDVQGTASAETVLAALAAIGFPATVAATPR